MKKILGFGLIGILTCVAAVAYARSISEFDGVNGLECSFSMDSGVKYVITVSNFDLRERSATAVLYKINSNRKSKPVKVDAFLFAEEGEFLEIGLIQLGLQESLLMDERTSNDSIWGAKLYSPDMGDLDKAIRGSCKVKP